jgi:hypothetical protein
VSFFGAEFLHCGHNFVQGHFWGKKLQKFEYFEEKKITCRHIYNDEFPSDTRTRQEFKQILLYYLTSIQIWLIPLLHDSQSTCSKKKGGCIILTRAHHFIAPNLVMVISMSKEALHYSITQMMESIVPSLICSNISK